MRVLGLWAVCRKKKQRYKKKTPSEYTAENVLNREFSYDRQNEKWVTDITEFKYGSGSKAYLSAVLDLYERNIVAFSLSRRNHNTPLVLDTFGQAFQKYPDAKTTAAQRSRRPIYQSFLPKRNETRWGMPEHVPRGALP